MSDTTQPELREAAWTAIMQRHNRDPRDHFARISLDRADIDAAIAAILPPGSVVVSLSDLREIVNDSGCSTVFYPEEYERLRAIVGPAPEY